MVYHLLGSQIIPFALCHDQSQVELNCLEILSQSTSQVQATDDAWINKPRLRLFNWGDTIKKYQMK